MKILLLDIETAPHLAHVWGLWQQNVGLPQIMDAGYVLCWAAKWYGDKEIHFNSVNQDSSEGMLTEVHGLLNEADVVVHYNGTKFDLPTLNKEFLEHDYTPPAPYKQVDLLRIVRNQFRFPSNKLAYISRALGITEKVNHIGHELWTRCMAGDPAAWVMMEEYNKGDLIPLEELYVKILPWIKNHPNHGLYQEDKEVCPTCGSKHYHKRGKLVTRAGIYERLQCQDCGTWFRTNTNEVSPARKHLLVAGS